MVKWIATVISVPITFALTVLMQVKILGWIDGLTYNYTFTPLLFINQLLLGGILGYSLCLITLTIRRTRFTRAKYCLMATHWIVLMIRMALLLSYQGLYFMRYPVPADGFEVFDILSNLSLIAGMIIQILFLFVVYQLVADPFGTSRKRGAYRAINIMEIKDQQHKILIDLIQQ